VTATVTATRPKLSDPARTVTSMTDTDHQVLQLAGAHYRHEGPRLEVARARFGLTPTGFYATVNRLLDEPAAAVAEPHTVARLRRLRAERGAGRASRRLVA
jgi:hypothetical protein